MLDGSKARDSEIVTEPFALQPPTQVVDGARVVMGDGLPCGSGGRPRKLRLPTTTVGLSEERL